MASKRCLVSAAIIIMTEDEDFDLPEEEFSFVTLFAACSDIQEQRKRYKVERFVQDVVSRYSLDTFKTFFRVSKTTFEAILENIQHIPELLLREPAAGRPQISREKDLLMMLWYIGSQETIRSIADRFNVSESTFHSHNRRLLDVFQKYFLQKFVIWPNDVQTVNNEFEIKKNFPVCRGDKRFTDIFCGWPGRVHDARVFQNSPLRQRGPILCGQCHLLGDGAYPCKRWLITPYRNRGHLTRDQIKFNQILSSTRVIIENSFGILKGRFRRLQFVEMNDISYVVKAIITACILHNICILNQDELDEHFDNDPQQVPLIIPMFENDAEGQLKRQLLTRQLAIT
uniref:DDE Tnp4 domain-containing protein n=1 Tax=Magallana gigas TaxID=29159 RepID=A0A8W8P2C4_MAGGI